MPQINQKGIAHILLILTVLGIVATFLILNTFSFNSKTFSKLFGKDKSFASLDTIQIVDSNGTQITSTTSATVKVKLIEPIWQNSSAIPSSTPAPTPGPNLVKNPGCEQNTSGWGTYNSTLSKVSIPHLGSYSCQVAWNGKGSAYTIDDSPSTVSFSSSNPAVTGTKYSASAWVRSTAAVGKTVNIVIRMKGGTKGTINITSTPVTLSNTWQQLNVSTLIDAIDRTSLEVYIQQNSPATNNSFQADDIILTRTTPQPSPTTPAQTVTSSVTLAEDPGFIANIQTFNYPLVNNPLSYTFSDPTTGTKTIYAKFTGSDGSTQNATPYPATIILQPPASTIDLDVTYIERTPRYNRYKVTYINDFPTIISGTENEQKWPNAGDTVTFIAHVKNQGINQVPEFDFKWFIDGVEVKSGTHTALNSLAEETESITWLWQNGAHTVKFVADPGNKLAEFSKVNNQRQDRTDSLDFRFRVDQTVYQTFNSLTNVSGTKSFEDWLQAHVDRLNQKLTQSGATNQARVDQLVVMADHVTDPGGTHTGDSGQDFDVDGRWGFVVPEWCKKSDGTVDVTCTDTSTGPYVFAPQIQVGLIHEWVHQLGMPHSYDANVDIATDNHITGTRLIQLDPSIVGVNGADDVGFAVGPGNYLFTPYFVSAINTNSSYRRGYYAEYLFDIPNTNILAIKDVFGNPLANASIRIWQSQNHAVSGNPIFTGTTDASGQFTLPNQNPTTTGTTATGHTLKANPFGQINVTGPNGLFLIEVTNQAGSDKDYRLMTVHNFNQAYWKGQTTTATYNTATFVADNNYPSDIALSKTATASTNPTVAFKAVDGDYTSTSASATTGFWEPANGQGQVGDWLQIDLGQVYNLYKFKVFGYAGNPHDFYSAFHIEVSQTGAFAGEQVRVATETNWDLSRRPNSYMTYVFGPTQGRFVRFVSDVNQNFVKMQELEVYRLLQSGESLPTPTPSPTPTPQSAPSLPLISAPGCSNTPYQATISWASVNPNVAFIDVGLDSGFGATYNKAISSGVTSTLAPDNFTPYSGVTGPLVLNPNTTYYTRTFNYFAHSPTASFRVPNCP